MNKAFAHLQRGEALPISEGTLQRQIVELYERCGRRDVMLCHIPNELADTENRRFAQAKLGMWAGAPDLVFFTPAREPLCFLELKATGRYVARKGNQSGAREWIESAGHRWAQINNFDDAYRQLAEWGLLRFADGGRRLA